MDFFVYNRTAIEQVRPHEVSHIIISITSTREDVAVLRANDHCLGILRLSFLDAEESSEPTVGAELFSLDQAKEIWTFVERHQDDVQRILVHCDMGISRSTAVAAAASCYFQRQRRRVPLGGPVCSEHPRISPPSRNGAEVATVS